jgi:hypothetical protein
VPIIDELLGQNGDMLARYAGHAAVAGAAALRAMANRAIAEQLGAMIQVRFTAQRLLQLLPCSG